jgi:His/Glu/Gln/Arg/opine family amino acid ABC transporter permease subunit
MINIDLLIESLPLLLQGLGVSLQIALLSSCIGIIGGFTLALLQISEIFGIPTITHILTGIVRGTPMLIQIWFFYYALPYWSIDLDAFWVAIIAIGINSSAYISQVIRAGIQAVPKGQYEAAQVIGLNSFDTFRYIILPQTLGLILPSLGNEFVTLVKDSALASIIGVAELSKAGRIIVSRTYDSITIFAGVAVLYLIITTSISYGISLMERKVRKSAQHR